MAENKTKPTDASVDEYIASGTYQRSRSFPVTDTNKLKVALGAEG